MRRMSLGHTIAMFREKHFPELTQEELAKYAGISRNHLAHIEAGDRIPTLKCLLSISWALGLPAFMLLQNTTTNLTDYLEENELHLPLEEQIRIAIKRL
jgi:DNA-binding XRE family transcriptional regulator